MSEKELYNQLEEYDKEIIKKFYSKPRWIILSILSCMFYYWLITTFIKLLGE